MKDLISKIISRRTLQTNKECNAYLFNPIKVKESTHYNKTLQGFTISGAYVTSMKDAEQLIDGLEDIYINLLNSHEGSEILFVKGHKDTLNAWYKMMFEGQIAELVCKKFNFFEQNCDPILVKQYKDKVIEERIHSDLIQI